MTAHSYGQAIIFYCCGFYLLLLFSSPNLSGRRLDVYHFDIWCGLSTKLECRSEMCCTRLAGNTGRKHSPKNRHLHTIAQLCLAISPQLRHASTIGINLLNSNISSTYLHNMVKFGSLTAEIVWWVFGRPPRTGSGLARPRRTDSEYAECWLDQKLYMSTETHGIS